MRRLVIIFFLSLLAYNQIFAQSDTLLLPQVELTAKTTNSISKTGTRTTFDSIVILKNKHQNIAQLLNDNAAVQIQNYGLGQSASANIRGMGASHTQVYWQNIPLNSSMLGQTDFSLLPTGLFSEITLTQGASSNTQGNGGLGGNLILNNNHLIDNQKIIKGTIAQQISNISNFSTLFNFNYLNKNKYTRTKFFSQNSQNHFRYRDRFTLGQPLRKAQNAEFQQYHLMQSFGFRPNKKNTLHAHLWLTDSDRNLAFSTARQQDWALRSAVSWESDIYDMTLAYIDEKLDYTDKSVGIISESRSQRVFARTSLRKSFDQIRTQMGFTFAWDKARAPGYASGERQVQSSIFSDNELIFNKIKIKLLLREEWRDGNFSPLLYTINVSPHFDIPFKLNFIHSRNIHYPTFNDRYWQPGGNPDLQAEKAYHWEVNLGSSALPFSENENYFSIKTNLALYHTRLQNRIQWLPTDAGFWTPSNVKRVHSIGLEARVPMTLKKGDWLLTWTHSYALTHTTDQTPNTENIGNRLAYIPLHKWNNTFTMSNLGQGWSWEYQHGLTDTRFTLSDNSAQLPAYQTGSLSASYDWHLSKKINLRFDLRINNLWNVDYEVVQGFPMPLRYGELVLSLLSL